MELTADRNRGASGEIAVSYGMADTLYDDVLAHRNALRLQNPGLLPIGNRQERWTRAQVWSDWRALLCQPASSGASKKAQKILLRWQACVEPSHLTWWPEAAHPECVWNHPVAEALVRFHDGNGVDRSWLLPLIRLAHHGVSGDVSITLHGPNGACRVGAPALAVLCLPYARPLSSVLLLDGFWTQEADQALDMFLEYCQTRPDFRRAAPGMELFPFFQSMSARPSVETMQRFKIQVETHMEQDPTWRALAPWVKPLSAAAHARRLDEECAQASPRSACAPRF